MHAGLFAEGSWAEEPWTFSIAGRLDRWQVEDGRLDELNLVTGAPLVANRYPDREGWLPTARAAAGVALTPELSLRAAAYLGWRMPTLNELFRPFRAGRDATAANAFLDPERLGGAEAGIGWKRGEMAFDLTLFANRLSDAIANVTLGEGPGTFPGVGFVAGDYRQRRNLDAIVSRGLEAGASWRRGPWRVQAVYSFARAEVDASGAAAALDGRRPAQTPRHSASASVGWAGRRAERRRGEVLGNAVRRRPQPARNPRGLHRPRLRQRAH